MPDELIGAEIRRVTRKGERLVWDILEDVTKVFFTYNADRVSDGEAG